MKFSTQEEYGLRCLLQIARRGEGASPTIPEIATAEGLSSTHVAKILKTLRDQGFVTSTRGQSGGYQLACDPATTTVGSVLEAIGGKLYDGSFCTRHAGSLDICTHDVDCGVRLLWQKVQLAIDSVVENITLQEMMPQIPATNVTFMGRAQWPGRERVAAALNED